MPSDGELSIDDLRRVVGAARAMAQASAVPSLDVLTATILRITAEVTRSDRSAIYGYDAGAEALVLQANHPRDEALAAAYARLALTTKSAAHMRSLEPAAYAIQDLAPGIEGGVKHVAMIPLHVLRRPIGVLHLARDDDRPFDARALEIAVNVAELATVFLEYARLYADAQRRLEETRMLLDVARTTASSHDLTRSLEDSTSVLSRMLEASNAFVLLLDEDEDALVGVATSLVSFRDEMTRIRIPMTAPSLVVRAVQAGAPQVVEDALRAADVQQQHVARLEQKSLLAVPLIVRERALGVLLVDDTRGPRRWSHDEIERAELVASQMAVSVANAKLYDELRLSYTELARAQEELVKRERLAAIGQLSATLAHEVRNPLGVFFNSLATLAKFVPAEGDAATLLAIMGEEAQRLDRLVRELLEFARPREPALETESLALVLEGAISAASREHGTPICTDIAENLPPMKLDASMMRRAIVNLLANAVQASEQAGEVLVRALVEERGGRPFARVDIVDRGAGIAPEVAKRVFEPFFTTKATGTGIGLALVKGIIEGHRGRIELASTPGKGTTVTVLLPLEISPDPREPTGGW